MKKLVLCVSLIVFVLASCNTPGGGPCTLFLSPSSLSVPRGKSATFNVTVNSSCAVTSPTLMSIENPNSFPFGVSFVQGANLNATGTVAVNSNAALNSYTVTVVGTAVGSSQTIKALLNVAVTAN